MPAIDPTAFKRLQDDLGGDVEVVNQILQSFLEEAPKQLAQGREAAEGGRAQQGQHAYHSLTGTSATVGALQLCAACKDIEQAARSGVIPTQEQVARAQRLFEAVQEEAGRMGVKV